jgi:lysine 2,3-aminomutase
VGIERFRTSVGKGIELVERLRGYTSGLAVPTFVIDAPGGGGKVPLMPQYMISRSDKKIIVRVKVSVANAVCAKMSSKKITLVLPNCSPVMQFQ